MVDWIREEGPDTVGFGLKGRITEEDLRQVLPRVERLIRQSKKARVLVEFRDISGIEAKALWEEIKFDAGHYKDIGRLAIVGDAKWEKWLTSLATPFANEQARFFGSGHTDDAWRWLRSGPQPETQTSQGG